MYQSIIFQMLFEMLFEIFKGIPQKVSLKDITSV